MTLLLSTPNLVLNYSLFRYNLAARNISVQRDTVPCSTYHKEKQKFESIIRWEICLGNLGASILRLIYIHIYIYVYIYIYVIYIYIYITYIYIYTYIYICIYISRRMEAPKLPKQISQRIIDSNFCFSLWYVLHGTVSLWTDIFLAAKLYRKRL